MRYYNYIYLIFFAIAMIFSSNSVADVGLHLSMIHKKGINKGLILVSELYSLEKINKERKIVLQMKNGHKVHIFASFIKDPGFLGPSSTILITGYFFDKGTSKGINFSGEGIRVELEEEKDVELKNSGDQLLLLRVLPRVL